MKYPRVVLFALGLLAACASSRPEGTGIDAADDTTDAADTTGDGNDTTDAPATIDGATIDSSSLDATAIDAAPSDGVMPIDAPIDANTCPTSPCDLYAQCGCTSPLVCDLDFTDLMGNQCRAVNMAGTETSTCYSGSPATAQPSYCAGGYVCLGSGTNAACERYCDASSDCGQPRGQCVIQVTNGSGVAIPNVQVCSSNCNPVNSAAGPCPSGQGKCGFFYVNNALTGGTDRDIVQCTAPGAGTQGAACGTAQAPNDALCAANYFCTTTSTTACRRVCNRTTGGNECAGITGTSCIGFNPALTIGGTEYGVCG